MARKPHQLAWLSRATLAHDHLRRLVATSDDKHHSAIFLSTALLLTQEQELPKPVEPDTNWRGWTKAQLDHLWAIRGAVQTKRWALKATLMIATHDGQTLLDFLTAVRRADFIQSEGQEVAACLLAEQQGLLRRNQKGGYEVIPQPVESSLPDKIAKAPEPTFHRSQRKVWERCVDLGRLHFSGATTGHPLKPRTFPFLLGSTGVGKSHLCREVAKSLGAHFLPLTFGRWLPFGSRESRPTMFNVLDAIEQHERVCVFLDELDKAFGPDDSGSWTKSVLNEVFALLDRQLPIEEFARYQNKVTKNSKAEPTGIDPDRLWIIGCGTWQDLTGSQKTSKTIGFHGGDQSPITTTDIVAQVRKSKAIPAELLARFHAEPMLLTYPASDEIPELMAAYGLDRLAAEAGVNLASVKIDFSLGGMRIFEALAADLMLTIQRNKIARQP